MNECHASLGAVKVDRSIHVEVENSCGVVADFIDSQSTQHGGGELRLQSKIVESETKLKRHEVNKVVGQQFKITINNYSNSKGDV